MNFMDLRGGEQFITVARRVERPPGEQTQEIVLKYVALMTRLLNEIVS